MLVDVDNKNEWKECFDVSGVKLPTGLYFGASAATGDLAGSITYHNVVNSKIVCVNASVIDYVYSMSFQSLPPLNVN